MDTDVPFKVEHSEPLIFSTLTHGESLHSTPHCKKEASLAKVESSFNLQI